MVQEYPKVAFTPRPSWGQGLLPNTVPARTQIWPQETASGQKTALANQVWPRNRSSVGQGWPKKQPCPTLDLQTLLLRPKRQDLAKLLRLGYRAGRTLVAEAWSGAEAVTR